MEPSQHSRSSAVVHLSAFGWTARAPRWCAEREPTQSMKPVGVGLEPLPALSCVLSSAERVSKGLWDGRQTPDLWS